MVNLLIPEQDWHKQITKCEICDRALQFQLNRHIATHHESSSVQFGLWMPIFFRLHLHLVLISKSTHIFFHDPTNMHFFRRENMKFPTNMRFSPIRNEQNFQSICLFWITRLFRTRVNNSGRVPRRASQVIALHVLG